MKGGVVQVLYSGAFTGADWFTSWSSCDQPFESLLIGEVSLNACTT